MSTVEVMEQKGAAKQLELQKKALQNSVQCVSNTSTYYCVR